MTSREVKTEVELARYGNDVTIDTSKLFLPPKKLVPLKDSFTVIQTCWLRRKILLPTSTARSRSRSSSFSR